MAYIDASQQPGIGFRTQYKNTDRVVQPPDPRAPDISQPRATTGSDSRPGDNYHSGSSAENLEDTGGNESNNAADVRGAASLAQGHEYGRATPNQIASGLLGVFGPPGLGSLFSTPGQKFGASQGLAALGGGLDLGDGGIPAHQQYGAAGTADIVSGGVFDAGGRAYDPITGQALNSYGSQNAFGNSAYVQGIKANPFSIDSYLSDPENAQAYTAANAARAAGSNAALGFSAATLGDRGIYGGQDDTGGGITPEEADRLAQHVGQTEYGFEEHTVAPDTATNDAIQGIGYTGSGAAPQGSQFSSTGTFSSSHSSNQNDSDNNDSFNDQGVSHSGGSGGVSFADDAASSNDGGGGGK